MAVVRRTRRAAPASAIAGRFRDSSRPARVSEGQSSRLRTRLQPSRRRLPARRRRSPAAHFPRGESGPRRRGTAAAATGRQAADGGEERRVLQAEQSLRGAERDRDGQRSDGRERSPVGGTHGDLNRIAARCPHAHGRQSLTLDNPAEQNSPNTLPWWSVRYAPLYFGRNEGAALRCVYHGWAFDADGDAWTFPASRSRSATRCGCGLTPPASPAGSCGPTWVHTTR
jgi:hypothetical protein